MNKFSVHNKKAQAYIDRDKAVTSPSYTRSAPFMMDHGVGSEFWDIDVAITEAESEGLD